jgi:hypothetical protein
MKNKLFIIITFVFSIFLFVSCKDKKAEVETIQHENSSNAASNIDTDNWLGQWNGPEGTFLKLTGSNGKYEIIIQNLDGPQTYTGVSVNNEIQFKRNGVIEKIHATNGAETGMKWLSEKQNCLTIHYGEGFCRD